MTNTNLLESTVKAAQFQFAATEAPRRIPTPIALLNRLVQMAGGKYSQERWRVYFDPIPELSEGLPVPILGVMILVWQLRERDLQCMFPLDSEDSRLDFIAWCVNHGMSEYAILRQAELLTNALDQPIGYPDELDDRLVNRALTWRMYFLSRSRPDIGANLELAVERQNFLAWYLLHGWKEGRENEVRLTHAQVTYFQEASSIAGLTRAQALVYRSRIDLRDAFPLPRGLEQYLRWYSVHFSDILNEFQKTFEQDHCGATRRRVEPKSNGVNVIGYAYGDLGIGEDCRMAVKALSSVGYPVTLLNFSPGPDVSQGETSMRDFVSDKPRYQTNIFCLTALEHCRHFVTSGVMTYEGRHNIGFWPWELQCWPEEWEHLFCLVDEVWSSSRYTYLALAPVAPVPLKQMPMCVEIGQVSKMRRTDFSLPENKFLFLFSFDLNSSAKRKNPQACIEAFEYAFPLSENNTDVGLVIKVHPPREQNVEWEQIKDLSRKDPRVHIVEETLTRPDLMGLYSICNCFISLHRAEGFGRNLAEAMLLGCPVLASGYSGNTDFTSPENAFLVKVMPKMLCDDDYPHGHGQAWAEPDVKHAASQMRKVVSDANATQRKATLAREKINSLYSAKVVGAQYNLELTSR